MNDKLSTSALAKHRDMVAKDLFTTLKQAGYVSWHESKWLLTDIGFRFGGEYRESEKYGRFIVWPTNLIIDDTLISDAHISATQIGEYFSMPAKKINLLLSELGWIKRDGQHWLVTQSGLRAGAYQRVDSVKDATFVLWHPSLLRNKRLKQSVGEFKGSDADSQSTDRSFSRFKQKFSAKHRTLDGHYVQSKGELIIDNWLYMGSVLHAYQRQLPIDTDVISDFYLPQGKVYIQFWGTDNGPIDTKTIEKTRQLYHDHEFDLIEIFPDELDQLDTILPLKLRPFGIRAY
ncbi:glycerol kinase [Vibrio methylphosphonaticus]|uniref:glycerol kinase n=1 Tax=Vibrio methylphosphonaticus TaxID=2946866 RepID=UPI00202A50A7|nr:glycerol kinase [Vibrio methylphosphonaticus]MCL9776922.1 glycerol kinase [Vibrio methylphosphonaticus]